MGGGARHLENFLRALSADPQGHTFLVLVRSSENLHVHSSAVVLKNPGGIFSKNPVFRFIHDQVLLPFRLWFGKFDAVVSLANFGPVFSPAPHILFERNALHFWDGPQGATFHLSFAERCRRWLIEKTARRATLIVAPTHAMVAGMQSKLPSIPKSKFSVLPHGFDLETSVGHVTKAHDCRGLKLLYVAHYAWYKGFEFLLRAVAELKRRNVDFRLSLTLGKETDSTTVASLSALAKDLGVLDSLVFLGRIPSNQMGSFYRDADALVFPSLCESFGFPLLEAMGNRVPVVATDLLVCREICGGAALYYQVGNVSDAADKILEVSRLATRTRLVDEGHKRMQSRDWSWRAYTADFIGLVSEAVDR